MGGADILAEQAARGACIADAHPRGAPRNSARSFVTVRLEAMLPPNVPLAPRAARPPHAASVTMAVNSNRTIAAKIFMFRLLHFGLEFAVPTQFRIALSRQPT